MTLLVISEDRYYDALRILALKIRRTGVAMTRIKKGNMLNHDHVERHIRAYLSLHGKVSRVLVCRDSECTPIAHSKGLCSEAERAISQRLPIPVAYIVVDHSVEGWLMCDANAVSQVVGSPVDGSKLRVDCRPADKLRRLFRTYGKTYDKSQHNKLLAEFADPEKIRKRSPRFQEFCEAIGHP